MCTNSFGISNDSLINEIMKHVLNDVNQSVKKNTKTRVNSTLKLKKKKSSTIVTSIKFSIFFTSDSIK